MLPIHVIKFEKKEYLNMYKAIKRTFDFILSILGIIILLPLFIIISLIIKLESKGPIFYAQRRIGKNGKVFNMYKFRSMKVGAEKFGVYEKENDPRVTNVGKFIRKVSIDELPQLFNIVKGEMSFIGPRPVLTYHPWHFEDYTPFQKRRFSLRPGVTGWAQINGRKNVEWNRRIELDIYYVEKLSLKLDIIIFFRTFIKVILLKDNFNKDKTVD